MIFDAIIVAAGSGSRAGGPKQWRMLGGKPVVRWSVEAMVAAGARTVVVVVNHEHLDSAERFEGLPGVFIAPGGATRALSVAAGLNSIALAAAGSAGKDAPPPDAVLVHDAARPLLTPAHVASLLEALGESDAAILALPVADTLKAAVDGYVAATVPREHLYRAQTPQAFRFDALVRAYAAWPADETPTDDAAMVERAGGAVRLVPGDPRLMKLTYPEDFAMAEALIGRTTRVGQGYDAHRFGPGDHIMLCGVKIAHDHGLVGHSDADVGLHAVTDAVMGAIGVGDIGQHFPPSDPQWKGAASDLFLSHAAQLVSERGGRVVNVDVTIVCEAPRIGPHRDAMRDRLAEILDLDRDAVSVKATTTEGMGFTGRKEGLAANAIVSVEI
ncbi:MAG TPA: bifunctional 2-C-methyl-D-erythritol 4-phosphate cytidylyltransferase/2-C-methyl-D-erythritol 2,4-cyclodiphosphate synthase [Caulobacteraceae bacterium]|jgi:2-C-methyl-D-erythritol 4-phosphate cytidylyltransferase/2-C-methyl-D-erythritol 2,4-cyclodiphosphate synthase